MAQNSDAVAARVAKTEQRACVRCNSLFAAATWRLVCNYEPHLLAALTNEQGKEIARNKEREGDDYFWSSATAGGSVVESGNGACMYWVYLFCRCRAAKEAACL